MIIDFFNKMIDVKTNNTTTRINMCLWFKKINCSHDRRVPWENCWQFQLTNCTVYEKKSPTFELFNVIFEYNASILNAAAKLWWSWHIWFSECELSTHYKIKLDRGSIRSSPRDGLSIPYRLNIRNSSRLFHIVL